jgi:ferritin-like protein
MPGGSTTLHEPAGQLREETINMHRAIVSLMEELEAVDWYQQRSEACSDAQLRDILRHNMEEEIEHATMTLEWIRRRHPKFDEALRTYLFTTGDITAIEEAETGGKDEDKRERSQKPTPRSTVGDMKGS